MRLSDAQKHANLGVVCSGNKMCADCRGLRKANKKRNNRTIRRINKKITEEAIRNE